MSPRYDVKTTIGTVQIQAKNKTDARRIVEKMLLDAWHAEVKRRLKVDAKIIPKPNQRN